MSAVERVVDQWWEGTIHAVRGEQVQLVTYTHQARGATTVLCINGVDFAVAAEAEGVYVEFSPVAARELAARLMTAAALTEAESDSEIKPNSAELSPLQTGPVSAVNNAVNSRT